MSQDEACDFFQQIEEEFTDLSPGTRRAKIETITSKFQHMAATEQKDIIDCYFQRLYQIFSDPSLRQRPACRQEAGAILQILLDQGLSLKDVAELTLAAT